MRLKTKRLLRESMNVESRQRMRDVHTEACLVVPHAVTICVVNNQEMQVPRPRYYMGSTIVTVVSH
jgi:hypothetical protein